MITYSEIDTLEPDFSEAASFLAMLGEDTDDWTFQTFDDRTAAKDRSLARILDARNGRTAHMLSELNKKGAGVFAMINRGDGKGRKAENVLEVRAAFVDLDAAPSSVLDGSPLEPHLVVESSPSRFHAYWRTEGLRLDQFETVQLALAHRFGGDPTVKDLPRVMRLPGFWHRKGAPFRTRILRSVPYQPYPAAELLSAFGVEPKDRTRQRQTSGNGQRVREGNRNSYLASLAGSMRRPGMTEAAIEAALLEENDQRCDPPLPREEVASIAHSIGRYAAASPQLAEPSQRGVLIRRLSDVMPRPIQWLWQDRIALGKLTLIIGDPGLGKSLLTVALAAHVSRANAWPVDHTPCPYGKVLLLSAEDDLGDTIRPRLDAAGANPHQVHALEAVFDQNTDGGKVRRTPNLARDLDRLDDVLSTGGFRLAVIDPLSAYLGGVDTHRNADLRAVLAPLADLASLHEVAIVCVSHLNKASATSAIYRAIGSIGFVAAARAVYAVTHDPEDEARRLILPVKNNLADVRTGLAYRIRQRETGAPFLEWDENPVSATADEVLAPTEPHYERSERDQAAEWLRELLASGSLATPEVKHAANEAGYAWRTVRRAQNAIGVKVTKAGFTGGWLWCLPSKTAN